MNIKTLTLSVERLLDNAATCSQNRELLRDDYGNEGVTRECVRLNVAEPLQAELTAAQARIGELEEMVKRQDRLLAYVGVELAGTQYQHISDKTLELYAKEARAILNPKPEQT